MFVTHARLSQYVNPAKRLPCLCLSPSLTAQLDISPFLQKKTSSVPSIEPLSGQVWPQDLLSRGGTLLFRRFLLRRRSDSSFFLVGLILGLNQPFCPHIWRWAGSGVRLGNDGIQSTKLDEQIILHEVCVTLCKFVMIVQYQQPID